MKEEEMIHCPGCDSAPCKCWAVQALDEVLNRPEPAEVMQARITQLQAEVAMLKGEVDRLRKCCDTGEEFAATAKKYFESQFEQFHADFQESGLMFYEYLETYAEEGIPELWAGYELLTGGGL